VLVSSQSEVQDPAMNVYLATERLDLRPFTLEDLDALEALDADPEVMRYINGGRPTSREELREDSLPFWLRSYERGDAWGSWAAIERATGSFIGWFQLRPQPHDPPEEPELGYRSCREAWDAGIATEGSRALIDKAFGELGARRVDATTMAVDRGSWRVMEKAGMRFVPFNGEWPDRIRGDVEYAITREVLGRPEQASVDRWTNGTSPGDDGDGVAALRGWGSEASTPCELRAVTSLGRAPGSKLLAKPRRNAWSRWPPRRPAPRSDGVGSDE
jgi:RimJ/RimL family protein N-acetyltransferase